jgi:amidohydrolase
MIQEGVLEQPKVQAIFGLHLGVGVETGTVGWTAGALLASSDRFVIEVEGQRSHGATPHKGLDPIPVAAEIVQALQLVVSRQLDAQSPKVLTIGSIHGGNRFNILADKVTLEGTLRSLDPAVRRELKERMARTIQGVAAAHGTRAALRFIGAGNAATINDATLARAVRPSLERVFGRDKVVDVQPQMVAEDFSAFAERVPAVYLLTGGRNAAKGIAAVNHSDRFDIDEDVLPLSVRAMATVIWDQLGRASR